MATIVLKQECIKEIVRRAYKRFPESQEVFKSNKYTSSLDTLIEEINPDLFDFSLDSLESLEDTKETLHLSILLIHLPHKYLYEEFGEEALLWTWVNYLYMGTKDNILKSIQELTKKDSVVLEKSRLSSWQLFHTSSTSTTIKTYDLIDRLNNGLLDKTNLKEILEKSTENGVNLSKKRIKDYSLVPLNVMKDYTHGYEEVWGGEGGVIGDKSYALYLDTPVGIGLFYKKEPCGILGFVPENKDSLMIFQLQGANPFLMDEDEKYILFDSNGTKVINKSIWKNHKRYYKNVNGETIPEKDIVPLKKSSRGLAPFDHLKLLTRLSFAPAESLGFKEVAIRSGHNNSWTRPYGDGRIHLDIKDALKIYDRTAKEMNFYQREDQNWALSLT